jgi:hypothetical protein
MRSPHLIEIPFVLHNIKITKIAGPLIAKMPEAYALADKVSAPLPAIPTCRSYRSGQPGR